MVDECIVGAQVSVLGSTKSTTVCVNSGALERK